VSTTSSETTETDASHSSHPSIKHESTISSTSGRLPLQLPVPNALVTQGPRPPPPPPLAGSFDTVPHPVGSGSPLPNNLQRQTSDEPTVTRLPSITPDGVLIEPGTRERSPSKFQHLIDSAHYLQDRMAFSPSSPTNRSSFGGWLSGPQHPGRAHADSRTRDVDTAINSWLKSTPATTTTLLRH